MGRVGPARGSALRNVMATWIGLAITLVSPQAAAEWLEASSDHFVIYGDQSEKSLSDFSERLELYHAVMADVFRTQNVKPSPSNRVTIFVVTSEEQVREIAGEDNRYLAGVYRPNAGSTIALVPRLKRTSSKWELSPETILLHEYAHHFMYGLTARAYPRWFVEGFAEFFAGVQFQKDRIMLGTPAYHRAYELQNSVRVPIRTLLSFDGGARGGSSRHEAFYGQSWALFHYLFFAPERAGQLDRYQQLLGTGVPAIEAAEQAFGDLDELETDVQAYWRRRRLSALVIEPETLAVGPVSVKPVSRGMAEMMPVIVRSRAGVTQSEARALLPEAQKVAARHPDDPAVLAALAEAEFDAGNTAAAIEAADRALAIDPRQVNAHLQKGYALFEQVKTGVLPRSAWKDVRQQFLALNRIENDHPIPLIQYFLTYVAARERPTPNAVEGLEWAMALAPFDASVRWLVAQQMAFDDRLADAIFTLEPLAYSPHPGEHTGQALAFMNELQARLAARQPSAAETTGGAASGNAP